MMKYFDIPYDEKIINKYHKINTKVRDKIKVPFEDSELDILEKEVNDKFQR